MPPSLLASPYPSSPLVSVAWLQTALGSPDLVILDASMAPPGQAKYVPAQIIPGARRFDFDQDFCDQSRLPHMMPSASDFTRKARQLGIQQNSVIVVYDHLGLFASPRAWWMFKSMGAAAVFVLDGGLPAWLVAGLSSTTCYGQGFPAGDFSARYQQRYCVDRTQVLAALDNPAVRIFDARPRVSRAPACAVAICQVRFQCRLLQCSRTAFCCRPPSWANAWVRQGRFCVPAVRE